jgi:3-hydroxyacyl-[acyl-carrier-protein] dehydratase
MRFRLIDQIVQVTPGQSLDAAKNLTLGEEYLADHFPSFPVMPGVLMLEALVQAGAWLLRLTEDFRHSMIVLREARVVKFGSFVEPGKQLKLHVDLVNKDTQTGGAVAFKGSGEVEGVQTVAARFTLARYNLADQHPELAATDQRLTEELRSEWLALSPR